MANNDHEALGSVIRKLDRLASLDDGDRAAMASLPFRISRQAPNHYLVREGDKPTACCMLLKGHACRHKTTIGGARQIVSFHIPGDILDVQHLMLPVADHNVQAITDVTVAWVPSEALKQVLQQRPAINEALWRDALIEASIFREWVLNVGRRDGLARVAHMLCEFAARREAAGHGSPERFDLPMTQEQIADATGLTAVHVNRMLQALGAEGVIVRNKREIQITDWDRMRRLADFDPAYLHLAA